MARGNQREKAREKNLKKTEKTKTTMSGTQMQHAKESNADIMRQKQAAAEARRAAEAAKK
ncbi:putative serf family protein [Fusarium flagelliforme]|uniref:putative serf family protein n=1 Tax=Fusarium flagelliforme TaxID=2675880 RepID=UPI001E8DDDF2|nr:putative serf family protein [Fusarium flagelliforme]KAH7173741.1 putative serf family protein [Fusarium flagelliforme]